MIWETGFSDYKKREKIQFQFFAYFLKDVIKYPCQEIVKSCPGVRCPLTNVKMHQVLIKFNNPNGAKKKKKDDRRATGLNIKSFVIVCQVICPSHRLWDSSHWRGLGNLFALYLEHLFIITWWVSQRQPLSVTHLSLPPSEVPRLPDVNVSWMQSGINEWIKSLSKKSPGS